MAKEAKPKDERDESEAESTQRLLNKIPPELWEKMLDENDLFPLALSCRFFRQKQKELVARTREKKNGSKRVKPRRTLKTNLQRKLEKGQPASVEYLRFCINEKLSSHEGWKKAKYISCLAAFHGHLPLLQELLGHRWTNSYHHQEIAWAAGKSLFHSLFFFFGSASDFFLAFSSSQRAEANWRPCSG